jgi:hypothetical protein
MIKQYYKSIGVKKKRKQDVIAFVNTVTQFIHRGSYAHIVTDTAPSGLRWIFHMHSEFYRLAMCNNAIMIISSQM